MWKIILIMHEWNDCNMNKRSFNANDRLMGRKKLGSKSGYDNPVSPLKVFRGVWDEHFHWPIATTNMNLIWIKVTNWGSIHAWMDKCAEEEEDDYVEERKKKATILKRRRRSCKITWILDFIPPFKTLILHSM